MQTTLHPKELSTGGLLGMFGCANSLAEVLQTASGRHLFVVSTLQNGRLRD